MQSKRGYTSKDREKVQKQLKEEREDPKKKKKKQGGGPPDGFLEEQQVDEIAQASQEAQDVLAWRYKRANQYNPREQFVPDADMIQLYKETEVEDARKKDDKYFHDGEFYGDEQKEKTQELLEADIADLMFLDDPDEPGYWPPILHTWDKESWGPKAPYYMHERIDKDKRQQQQNGNRPHSGVPQSSNTSGNKNQQQQGGKAPSNPATWQEDGSGDSPNKFYIFPLTWDQIGTDWTIVVLGKRRSGKTVFIKSLCGNYLRPFFPRVYVFTKSFYSGEYAEFVPEAHIYPGLTPDEVDKKSGKGTKEGGITVLAKIFQMQKKLKEASKAGKFHGNMNCLVIIDDCLSDGFRYQKLIDEVFFEGRHMNICFIVTSQDFKGVNPACTGEHLIYKSGAISPPSIHYVESCPPNDYYIYSGNADMCTQFRCRSERDKEAVRTKFCDFFKNDEEFEALTGQALQKKWHSVSYMQDKPHIDPRFTIFCGRPIDPGPFVLGCKRWWKDNQKQLVAIINENPELSYLLDPNADWGIMGEEEMNEELKHVPDG